MDSRALFFPEVEESLWIRFSPGVILLPIWFPDLFNTHRREGTWQNHCSNRPEAGSVGCFSGNLDLNPCFPVWCRIVFWLSFLQHLQPFFFLFKIYFWPVLKEILCNLKSKSQAHCSVKRLTICSPGELLLCITSPAWGHPCAASPGALERVYSQKRFSLPVIIRAQLMPRSATMGTWGCYANVASILSHTPASCLALLTSWQNPFPLGAFHPHFHFSLFLIQYINLLIFFIPTSLLAPRLFV